MSRRSAVAFVVLHASLLALLVSCASVPLFDQTAYQYAIDLKVDALSLMDKGTETFADHQDEVSALNTRLQKAYEYARGRPHNVSATKQWKILLDPERDLLGGFVTLWKSQSRLSPAYVEEKKKQIADAFDIISGLESDRIKPSEVR